MIRQTNLASSSCQIPFLTQPTVFNGTRDMKELQCASFWMHYEMYFKSFKEKDYIGSDRYVHLKTAHFSMRYYTNLNTGLLQSIRSSA